MVQVLIFYGAMLVPLLAGFGWSIHAGDTSLRVELMGAGGLYAVIVIFGGYWWSEWSSWLRPPQALSRRLLLLIVAAPMVTLAGAGVLRFLATGLNLPHGSLTQPLRDAGWPVWWCFGWIALVPAWFEEIAFRGILLTKLQRVMNPVQAMWVSALLFGIIHYNLLGIALFLVPLAVAGAWFTRRTQSLWPAIFIHFAHNAGVVAFELWGS